MASIINNPLVGPIVKASNIRTYPKGQVIVYPEDSNAYLYIIKDGAVAMENPNQAGERKILYIFGESSLFPMVSFLDKDAVSSWFYTALVDTQVYLISYKDLTEKLKHTDAFMTYNLLLRQILAEVHELLLRISDHAKTGSTEKLISMFLFLLEHHTKTTSSPWRLVQFPVTHQLLADMTGLTRETASLTLKGMAAKKLIRYHHKGRLELNATKFSKESHT